MVKCLCNKEVDSCDECYNVCKGPYTCVDDTLGISTDVFITLIVLAYVFWFVIIYFVIKTLQRCNNKPKWLAPVLITLTVIAFILGWIPILNIILILTLLVITMYYYTHCRKK